MNNLGTEVGVKMRCAVKAKLIELGTGGAAGYIDDELPDYVMIMVANKRSKSQMVEDLKLFLGSNTESFVSWLHQVLEKLQEVTLPQTAKEKKESKRKTSEGGGESTSKKDKKEKKREKRLKRSAAKETTGTGEPPAVEAPSAPEPPAQPSITDVFAEHLIQKARKTSIVEKTLSIRAKKEAMDPGRKQLFANPPAPENPTMDEDEDGSDPTVGDEFDIPTITEIAESAVELQRKQKELKELAEIQKKIYIAKNQLKNMCSDENESEDEDFINLKANEDDIDEVEEGKKQRPASEEPARKAGKRKPITYDNDEVEEEEEGETFSPAASPQLATKKKSVLDRLGDKQAEEANGTKTVANSNIISLSAHRKVERELYVPTFRRTKEYEEQRKQKQLEKEEAERARNSIRDRIKERQRDRDAEKQRERERERERDRERDREREREREARNRERERHREEELKTRQKSTIVEPLPDSSTVDAPRGRDKTNVRQRIGSRVFVMPTRTEDTDTFDVPVNSVVKITPRPNRPINKQACKNLLLRAVAEAQKSTSNIPMKTAKEASKKPKPNAQSIKERLELELRKRQKNLVIEVPTGGVKRDAGFQVEFQNTEHNAGHPVEEEVRGASTASLEVANESGEEEEEYVPAPVVPAVKSDSDSDYVYIPKTKGEMDYEPEMAAAKNTQFVVTLDGMYGKKAAAPPKPKVTIEKKRRSRTPPRKSIKDRIGFKTQGRRDKPNERRSRSRSPRKQSPVRRYSPKPQTRDRERERPRPLSSRRHSRSRSPHKNDYSPDTTTSTRDENRSLTPPPPVRRSLPEKVVAPEISSYQRKVSPINFNLTDDEHHSSDGEHGSPHKARAKRDSAGSKDEDGEKGHDRTLKKLGSSGKFDNLPPLLSSISVPNEKAPAIKKTLIKSLDRCKFFPSCQKGESCEFYHPTKTCKAFPNCKFGDKCQYMHPICRFNKVCARADCNFMHTGASAATMSGLTAAPPLASSVVPVQNYKSITGNPLPPLCKFYPNCTNPGCLFYHPKLCKFGKNCPYKLECNFYHFDLPTYDKLKWVSPSV